MVAMTA